eukprot:8065041-Ditylum_brightwellii.AAC.1
MDVEDHVRCVEADSCIGICSKVVEQVVRFFESDFCWGRLLGFYGIEGEEKHEINRSHIP